MEKLELKHLAGYLPYGLKAEFADYDDIEDTEILDVLSLEIGSEEDFIVNQYSSFFFQFKPILHPLSYLTKEIEVNGEKFVPLTEILNYEYYGYSELRYMVQNNNFYLLPAISNQLTQKLLEWHFDFYGLIENNLAVAINTLN